MPPGDGSAEMTAWSMPRREQVVAGLEAARAAADDDDGVVAGRERSSGPRLRVEAARCPPPAVAAIRAGEPPAHRLEHAVHDGRVGQQERLRGRGRRAGGPGRRADGHDVGDRRLREQERHLAEEVALAEARALLAVDADATSPSRMT